MECIFGRLNLTKPLDVSVTSCFSMIFYSVAHTGEFMLPTLSTFNPMWHVKPSNISNRLDCNNLEVTVFHLPKTKCSSAGEDGVWSCQNRITDSKVTLENHFQIKNLPADGPFFTYRHVKGLHPLTEKVFLDRINVITSMLGEDSLKGHRICISGTFEFLLQEMLFDVMKSLGCWTSEAFMLYLHQHATIIAPYIQNYPVLKDFTCYTMPQVRNHWPRWVAPTPSARE